jgi:hypothetical protein
MDIENNGRNGPFQSLLAQESSRDTDQIIWDTADENGNPKEDLWDWGHPPAK